jgi:pimeloyl-ACP methyl ester carboxylesterase
MTTTATPGTVTAPGTTATVSGYADVNGLHLYYEIHDRRPSGAAGTGRPLVLLHGGMLTIDLAFAELIPTLASTRRVIGLEMQGHGRTADIDRPITPANSARDVIALLDHLGLERADVLGHSMGAAVALELAVSFPERIGAVVAASGSVRPDGMHEDLADPSRHATSTRMPTQQDFAEMSEAYARLSPHPERFTDFLSRLSASAADLEGWSDEQLAGIRSRVLLVQGDHDFTTVEHAALMLQLIPGAQLAILPDTTHMQVTRRPDELLPMLARFLG